MQYCDTSKQALGSHLGGHGAVADNGKVETDVIGNDGGFSRAWGKSV